MPDGVGERLTVEGVSEWAVALKVGENEGDGTGLREPDRLAVNDSDDRVAEAETGDRVPLWDWVRVEGEQEAETVGVWERVRGAEALEVREGVRDSVAAADGEGEGLWEWTEGVSVTVWVTDESVGVAEGEGVKPAERLPLRLAVQEWDCVAVGVS